MSTLNLRWAYLVTTWNGMKLVETIHSIPKGSRLLVVDNSQRGWALSAAWNYGIARLLDEGFDAVVVMNDDVVLRPDSGENLVRSLFAADVEPCARHLGAGPRPEGLPQEPLLVTARHANHGDMFTEEVNASRLAAAVPAWQPGPDFSCFCVGRKLFEVVGRFDERFNPCYFEDNDMHRRIQLAGYEGYAVTPYWHFRSVTRRSDGERRAVIDGGKFAECVKYYLAKWGGMPGKETFTTPFEGRAA